MPLTVADLVALSRLLDDALTLPPPRQEAWLRALATSDRHLEPALRELLAEQARSDAGAGRLETLPRIGGGDAQGGLHEGDAVGPYRLLREIGRGGMSVVWLAERHDGTLQRSVALKMPLTRLTGTTRIDRFERERDVLARLAHPQIARLYDAGVTPSGRPFVVLEHVAGRPITEHCDALALDVAARVRLFLQVLAAVDHAHKHLVVHRDIKPSNVFVDDAGQVKLLDFGIAKLMPGPAGAAEATALTQDVGCALTPAYAAPEQVDGRPISTATDVYALGVLLHELLTGRLPHADAQGSVAEAMQALLHAEVQRPSRAPIDAAAAARRGATTERLRAMLAGDLDTVMLKALRKLPGDRYGTPERLADDLRAWLGHRPVAARPATLLHRTRLLLRRNRSVGIAAALGLAAAAVLAGLAWTQYRLGREEFARAEAVRDFMFDFVSDVEVDEGRSSEPTGREMLAAAVQRARRDFADRPRLRAEVLADLGRMHRRLGDEAGATALLAEAVALFEAGAPAGDGPMNKARSYLAESALAAGRADEAATQAASVVERCRAGDACTKARFYARTTLASVEMRRGRFAMAIGHARQAVQESEAAFGPADEQTAHALHTVAIVARQAADLPGARAALDRALAINRDLRLRQSDRVAFGRTSAILSLDLGDYRAARDQALALAGEARETAERVLLWRLAAQAQTGLGLVPEAIEASQQAIGVGDPKHVQTVVARQVHARALALRGDTSAALDELAAVVQGLASAGYAPVSLEVLRARRFVGEAQLRGGDVEGGLKTLLAVAHAQEAQADGQAVELAQVDDLVGCALREQGLAAEALAWHAKAAALLEKRLPADHPHRLRNEIYRRVSDAARRGPDDEAALQRVVTRYLGSLPDASVWRAALDRSMKQDACRRPNGDACRLIL